MASDTEGRLAAQIANPKALGFGAFAILLWMYGMILVGWFPEAASTATAQDASFIATAALLVAALVSFLRGETWHAVFFMFWSAYGWRLGQQGGEVGPEAFRGWFYGLIAVFQLFLALGAFRDQKLKLLRPLLALGLSLSFVCAALGSWGLGDNFFLIDGYNVLLMALLSFWITGAELGALPEAAWSQRKDPAPAT